MGVNLAISSEPSSAGYRASRFDTSVTHQRSALCVTDPGYKRLALSRRLGNDLSSFAGRSVDGNLKVAIVAYCVAVGFILFVAFHSSSKTLIAASVPAVTPLADR